MTRRSGINVEIEGAVSGDVHTLLYCTVRVARTGCTSTANNLGCIVRIAIIPCAYLIMPLRSTFITNRGCIHMLK